MNTIPKFFFVTAIATVVGTTISQPVHAFTLTFPSVATGATGSLIQPDASTPSTFSNSVTSIPSAPSYNYSLNINLSYPDLTNGNAGVSNLEGYLTRNSDGKTLNLFASLSGANLTNTTFIDGATKIISDPTVSAPFPGSFAPEANTFTNLTFPFTALLFSDFNDGTSPATTWTLSFFDPTNSNVGTLNSATLDITPVPFEFDGTAGVAILGGSFALRRWYKKRKESIK